MVIVFGNDFMVDIIMMLMGAGFILRLQDKFEVHQNSKYPETERFPGSHLLSFHFFLKNTILPSTWGQSSQRTQRIQSGASSRAKHGGAYFSAVYGSIVNSQ